jgi:protein CWC15
MSNTTTDLGGLSRQYAARDMPSHVKLKYREIGQGAPDEAKKDKKEMRKELEDKEKSLREGKRSSMKDDSKEEKSTKKLKLVLS